MSTSVTSNLADFLTMDCYITDILFIDRIGRNDNQQLGINLLCKNKQLFIYINPVLYYNRFVYTVRTHLKNFTRLYFLFGVAVRKEDIQL